MYSIKKFVQVVNIDGEVLLGYSDEKGVFYYTPGMLIFMEYHSMACGCYNCKWVRDYDEEINVNYQGPIK